MRANKAKEKGSQHDPKHVANKEETPVGGAPQNTKQRIINMAKVAVLLKQERAKAPK